jgi:hypothetical protein
MHGLLFLWRIAKSECHMCIHPTGPQTQEKEKLPRNGSELVTYAEAYPCLVVQLFPSRSLLHSIINPYIYIYIKKIYAAGILIYIPPAGYGFQQQRGREEEGALVMAWCFCSKLTGVRITVRFSSDTEPEQPLQGRCPSLPDNCPAIHNPLMKFRAEHMFFLTMRAKCTSK